MTCLTYQLQLQEKSLLTFFRGGIFLFPRLCFAFCYDLDPKRSNMSKSFIDRCHMRLFRPLLVLLFLLLCNVSSFVLLFLQLSIMSYFFKSKICSLLYLNIKGLTKEPLFLLYTVLLFVCTYKCSLPLGPYVVLDHR